MSKHEPDHLHAMRHSLAHIMAASIQKLWPEAKFGVGPVVADGFYYDVDLPHPVTPDDLKQIETGMKAEIKANHKFERFEMPIDEALDKVRKADQTYKVELLEDLKQHGTTNLKDVGAETLGAGTDTVSFYRSGDFEDLCRGPHVASTGKVGAFRLHKVSGAYWRGKDTNPQLQRIYGVAFPTEKEVQQYFERLEEAEKRDHRKIGAEMDLFVFSDLVGSGLPLWTPRGTVMRAELDAFVQELRSEYGFQPVAIPHITKKDLYEKSGHWDKFKDELFRITTREGHEFAMKPMNCPHHAQIYASRPHSYRDLPIRYSETTMVYRDEQSGELSGLSRVRAITQDDAHVFCRKAQIRTEIEQIWDIVERFYGAFNIDLKVRLSSHDPDQMSTYLGEVKQWNEAVSQLREVVEAKGVDYIDGVGEAAFYGPKIDFLGYDALGREFQASTIQLDFGQPERFGLVCTNEAGEEEPVVMIHCAIAGSLERCMVLVIEHYAGRFPLWLAPEQVRVATVADDYTDYGRKVVVKLEELGLRVGFDGSSESVGKKIRAAELAKVPYTLVIGDKEKSSGKVTPRVRADLAVGKDQVYGLDQFAKSVSNEARARVQRSSM